MLKIIHCADVHLSSDEKEYSFAVLNEIVDIANSEKAHYLLLAGDTFDTFEDIVNLQNDFSVAIKRLHEECEVLLLAGNHEDHKRNKKRIASYDLGVPVDNIIDTDSKPFILIERDEMEFLAIPHQNDYKGYTEWNVPEKKAKWRIALAHASNTDLSYIGFNDEEEKASVIDSDLFVRFHVDYAALGHIHGCSEKTINKVRMAYPGSPRVWRKGENGPRYIILLECTDTIKSEKRIIKAAGQFREYIVNLTLDCKQTVDLKENMKEWGPNDWIFIEFRGLIEDESQVNGLIEKYNIDFKKNVRRFDVDKNKVESCAGISTQEIAKKFLMLWESKKPAIIGDELDVWQRARDVGLRKIKEHMEARL